MSHVADPSAFSIPFLVQVALAACDALSLEGFQLSGHSMGGLTPIVFAHDHQGRVVSFVDIEGNIAPEDCFLSRQTIEHPANSNADFVVGCINPVRQRAEYGSFLYTTSLPLKVSETICEPIFRSIVELLDDAPFMEVFTGQRCPRYFIFGEQNRRLSFLGYLLMASVEFIQIPHAGHFPMYSIPPARWAAMANFLEKHDLQP